MTKHVERFLLATIAMLLCLPAPPARAQNARSFVSGTGADTNACTLPAPCRSFARAIAVTNAGGEIDVLNPAGYGPVIINKAISIVNDGVGTSSVLPSNNGAGISIAAGPNDAISLRGLTIDGEGGTETTGISFTSGQSLTVENCVIRHNSGDGIDFLPTASSNLTVSGTLTADNTGSGIVLTAAASGALTAVFNRIETNNNGAFGLAINGGSASGAVNASIAESVAGGNTSGAFSAAASNGAATLMMYHSLAANSVNGTGVAAAGANATVRLAQSMVTGNGSGWTATGGASVQSYGDNYIDGNTNNQTAPTSTPDK